MVESGQRSLGELRSRLLAERAADGITVNALNPGAIATNLQRHAPSLPATVEPIWC
jgi:NAD(P)-dependent dehydrogenase (short-subunit alcohol dehydrogenase family)